MAGKGKKQAAKTIMIQGTSSNVGKSVLAAALCRIFKQDGLKVAPFKSQNMALNAFVTSEGGEIGRAQAVQAEAAGIPASIHMNPVLIKPEADSHSQIVVHGKATESISAADYYKRAPLLLEKIRESFGRLSAAYDVIVIEGAGSPAEINLKEREIVNMRMAREASSPVLLVGDIDRGGVFASLVGTLELLTEDECRYVKGFIINKFRGDISLLQPAIDFLEERTGRPVLGTIPYFRDISIAQEDSVFLDEMGQRPPTDDLDIVVVRLPRIANYDDFDPLEEDGSRLRYITKAAELGDPDLIILPGTKSTFADLEFLNQCGLSERITQKAEGGTPVIGVCGGYQMLSRSINDPERIESESESVPGLGLLPAVTTYARQKATSQVKGRITADRGLLSGMAGQELIGYEIHMGQTQTEGGLSPFRIYQTPDGAVDYEDGTMNASGTVLGTYMHGIFNNSGFRQGLLNWLRRRRGLEESWGAGIDKEKEYDRLADLVRRNLDMERLYKIMEGGV
ncbi:MAG: cobyric acid synthase [Dehalococcoidales bacterium]